VALWIGGEEPGDPIATWAVEKSADGGLRPSRPVPGWVEHTRRLQEDHWNLEEAATHGTDGLVGVLREHGHSSWLLLPLRTLDRLVGGLALAGGRTGAPIAERAQLAFLSNLLAIFVQRILRQNEIDRLADHLRKERDEQKILLQISNELVRHREPLKLFQAIYQVLKAHLPFDGMALFILQKEEAEARLHFIETDDRTSMFMRENRVVDISGGPMAQALEAKRPLVFDLSSPGRLTPPNYHALVADLGLTALCCTPLLSRGQAYGTLIFGAHLEGAFPPETVDLLDRVSAQVAIALDNAFAYQEIQTLRDRLAQDNLYLHEELERDSGLDILGRSSAIQQVLRQVETVASSDATVLILGETGTGKELVARAIHNLSRRAERNFVQINCASIPSGLVESELFGHEKGAFTGAINQKLGRMELAHEGTLFLDEIGDLPLEAQPKLLRALQEQQFDRVGGTRPRKVDVRLIAATNRDLTAMMEAREFRVDLFYRLNVFPIRIPPLRERREDIPILVRYFTQKFAQRMHRPIETIQARTMDALSAWDWPGNVRELENFIERSVILSPGRELLIPVSELGATRQAIAPGSTLEALERDHILKTLQETRGKVGGIDGAAARLGLKRTTLLSRMEKLGIQARHP
jgi:formate hydrogenlyase transcriptional activator